VRTGGVVLQALAQPRTARQTSLMPTAHRFAFTLLALFTTACSSTNKPTVPVPTRWDNPRPFVADRWQKQVNAYLEADATSPPPQSGVVFVGSSSIRGWRTLADDFPGIPVIGRGVGGCYVIDTVRYADALVLKHRPKVVVLYAGENDITDNTPPAVVCRHVQTFVDLVRAELPDARILYISAKPSPSRAHLMPQFKQANEMIRAYMSGDPNLVYVDVWPAMLDDQGNPLPELFVKDMLHMNALGYARWKALIAPHLR
jgi:lysophospholipase L1-like esterase